MKALNEKVWSHGTSAWGNPTYTAQQRFEVEASDVGIPHVNYRGQGHSTYTFRASDVGRTISVYTDKSNWTCWIFQTQKEVSA